MSKKLVATSRIVLAVALFSGGLALLLRQPSKAGSSQTGRSRAHKTPLPENLKALAVERFAPDGSPLESLLGQTSHAIPTGQGASGARSMEPASARESLIGSREDTLKEKNGIYGYNSSHYGATLGTGTIDFEVPYQLSNERRPGIRYSLKDVRLGESVIAKGGPTPPSANPEDREVIYARGPVEEKYILRSENLEQVFVINELPRLRGDLTVTGAVTTELEPPIEGAVGSRLSFTHEGREAIFFSEAIAFDAAGKSLALQFGYSKGQISLTIPEAWLAQATAPIVIDPLVGSPFSIDTSLLYWYGSRGCDVAYNSVRNEWLVVWNEQFGATTFDCDVYGRRVSSTGTLLGSALGIGNTSHGEYDLSVSYAADVDRYLVAFRADPTDNSSQTDNRIDGRIVNGDGTFFTAVFTIDDSADLQQHPSACYDGTNWYVCFESKITSPNSNILGRFVTTSGGVGSQFNPDTSASVSLLPTVGFTNGTYMIAWRQGSPIVARTMNTSGSFLSPITTVQAAFSGAGNPDLSAGNGKFLITWSENPSPFTTFYLNGRIANTSMGFETAPIAIKTSSSAQYYPRSEYSTTNNEWLTAYIGYETGTAELYVSRVSSTAQISSSERLTVVAVGKWEPELAWNPTTNEMLVAYFQNISPYQLWALRYSMNSVAAPASFTGTVQSDSSILWSWGNVTGESGFNLHDPLHVLKGYTNADVLSFTESGLTENTLITRHVHGNDGFSPGPASNSDSKYTYVHAPVATDFTAGAPSSTQLTISVAPPPNFNVGQTACKIEKSPDNSAWSILKDFPTSGWSATDSGLTASTTYWYRITYRNFDGVVTATSASKSFITPPAVPSGFTGTAQTTTTILWTWADVAGETGYELHDENHQVIASMAANAINVTETVPFENTLALRHLHAVNAGGFSSPTAASPVYSKVHNAVASDFSVVTVTASQIDVLVTPPPNGTSGTTGVQIEHQLGAGAWTVVRPYSNVYTFSDTGLTASSTYNYRITFRNGNSVASTVSATNTSKTNAPPTPAGFGGSAQTTNSITWSWNNVANETGFEVHDATEAVIGTTGVNVLSFLETGLLENTSYIRHVHAANGLLKSAGSTAATTFAKVHDPVVGDFSCQVVTSTQIDIIVTPPPNGTSGTTAVQIQRSTNGTSWTTIKTFATAGYTKSDTGRTAGTLYYYRIRFRNGNSIQTLDSAAQTATTSAPIAPTGFGGVAKSPTSILWSWTDVTGEASYVLHDAGEVQKGTAGPQITSILESTGLSENAPFTRHVHAINGISTGPASGSATVYAAVHDPLEGDLTPLVVSLTSVEVTVTQPPNPTTLQTGCEIQRFDPLTSTWSAVKAFSNSYSFTDTIPSGSTAAYRIRYRNADGLVTAESPVKVVSMTPILLLPLPGGATTSTTPVFDWSDVPGKTPLTYDLQVDNNADFSSPEINQTGLVPSTFTPGAGLATGLYYWRVRAKCAGANFGPYSTVATFSIDTTAPGAPTLATPANGSFVGTTTPTFGWSVVSDPTGVTYHLQVSTNVGFTAIVADISNLASASYTLPSALAGVTHYWRVQAKDSAGNTGGFSSTFSFTVDVTSPPVVTLISPGDGTSGSSGTPTFTWNAVSDPSGITYRFQIDTEQTFAAPLYMDQPGLSAALYTPPLPIPDGSYLWRVLAVDGAGNTSASAVWRYTIDSTAAPSTPVINLSVSRKTTTQKPQVSGKCADITGVTISVYFDGNLAGTTTVDGASNWVFNPPSNQSFGTHLVQAKASKAAVPDSPLSFPATITIDQSVTPASELTVTAINGQILLTWVASPDPDVIGYQVYKSISGGAFNLITGAQLVVDTKYTDGSLTNGTTYAYRVRAVDNTLQEGP